MNSDFKCKAGIPFMNLSVSGIILLFVILAMLSSCYSKKLNKRECSEITLLMYTNDRWQDTSFWEKVYVEVLHKRKVVFSSVSNNTGMLKASFCKPGLYKIKVSRANVPGGFIKKVQLIKGSYSSSLDIILSEDECFYDEKKFRNSK